MPGRIERSNNQPPAHIDEAQFESLAGRNAYFTVALYFELKSNSLEKPPLDILLVGDNWIQLMELYWSYMNYRAVILSQLNYLLVWKWVHPARHQFGQLCQEVKN